MKKLNQCLLIFAAGLLLMPMLAHGQADYDYQTIEYPGAVYTDVRGINNRGDVVGTASDEAGTFPFIYDSKDATFTDVPPVAGYDYTLLEGISDSGILAGTVVTEEPPLRSGLLLDKEGNAIVFDHPDAVAGTVARDVNNEGLVVGYIDVDEEEEFLRGFIYDSNTASFTDIVPSVFTIAADINSKGDVVGHALFVGYGEDGDPKDPCGDAYSVRYGWLRKADGSVIYFDVNGQPTSARGITDSGTIVGWVNLGDAYKGFVTELDDTPCQSITIPEAELLFPPDVNPSFPYPFFQGIKNSGEVVGAYEGIDGYFYGFIATPQ